MFQCYAVFEKGGEFQTFEYDPGVLRHSDVEIEVEHCGICHSDLSMVQNDWGFSTYPLVPGHEVVGTITAVGQDVTHLKTGERVGLGWHAGYCLTCSSCLSGDHNLCANASATIVGRHGGFANKVRADAMSVVRLPKNLNVETAGPLFCGGITVFNPILQFGIKPTDRVAVIGIGGLGHLALKFLNAWGCHVTAFTSSESKKKEALSMGAHQTINSRDPDEIKAAAGQFDFVISTVNVTLAWQAYIETLKPRGRFHFVGAALEPLNIMAFPLISAQRSISGSPVGSPAAIAKMLDFAARHDIRPVTENFRMSDVNQAMQHLKDGKARYRIVLSR